MSSHERGATLTTLAFATAVLLLALGTMYLVTSRTNLDLVHHHRLQTEADYLAEGGIERGIQQLRTSERRPGEKSVSRFELPNGVVELRIESVPDTEDRFELTSTSTLHMTFEDEEVSTSRRVLVTLGTDGAVEILRYHGG